MKDLLVLCDASDTNRFRVDTAFSYAKHYQSHITGAYMVPFPLIPVYGGMYPDASSYSASYQTNKNNQQQEAAKKYFIQAAHKKAVNHEWQSIEGLDVDYIIDNAGYYDMIIAPYAYCHYNQETSHHLCDYLSTHLGRPLLVIPDLKKVFTPAKKIIIAWKESHEAARAVHESLNILKNAEQIQIVHISKHKDNKFSAQRKCEKLQQHLLHHNIESDILAMESSSHDTGHCIHESAIEFNADLIVMGAYGHSRFREIILGGTTRYLLEHSTMPLFVSN